MQSLKLTLFLLLFVGLAASLIGCGHSSAPSGAQSGNVRNDADETASVAKAMASLPAEARAVAEEQRICPVTEKLLGSMGKPVEVDVTGHQVFICCDGCKDRLLKNPETYLAKLKK